MSHIVDYGNIPDPKAKAMEDIKFWLGDTYPKVENALIEYWKKNPIEEERTMECLEFQLSFAGIQGYPARVLIEHAKEISLS